MIHDKKIEMVRGAPVFVGSNPYALPNSPEAVFDIRYSGAFVIVQTQVSLHCDVITAFFVTSLPFATDWCRRDVGPRYTRLRTAGAYFSIRGMRFVRQL